MGRIALEGMTFFARHGFYEEEQILGNHFIVDVYVETDFSETIQQGAIPEEAIDDEVIYLIARFEMEKPSKLLEHVGQRIVNSIKAKYPDVETKVRIKKCNPPLGGRVKYSVVETSGLIGLEEMEFFAPIGIYKENKLVANEFLIDVFVKVDTTAANQSDNLSDTLSYEAIYWATKTEMGRAAQTLENAAQRIASNLKDKFNNILQIKVNVRKKNPPLRGHIPNSAVQIKHDHTKACARCKRPMLCYNDKNCWCTNHTVLPATSRMISKLYKGCLCSNCIKQYAVK